MTELDPAATPETKEDFELRLSFELSAVQCLPDFTGDIANLVGGAIDKATRVRKLVGNLAGKLSQTARNVGELTLYLTHEGRDDYRE